MLILALLVFLIAAIFGAFVLTKIFKNEAVPAKNILTHGSIAILGLLLLIITVYQGNQEKMVVTSLTLFVLAALGGVTMVVSSRMNKPLPKWVVIFHPILAIVAIGMLLTYVLQ